MNSRIATVRELLAIAAEIAGSSTDRASTRKDDGSLLTATDILIETAILRAIGLRHPDDLIISEERDGPPTSPPSEPYWAIDPIDGTTNFSSGLPIFATSVAFCSGRVAEVGGVHSHVDNVSLVSSDARTLERKWRTNLDEMRIAIDFEGCEEDPRPWNLARSLVARGARVRIFGSTTLGLTWVAEGKFDAFLHPGSNIWDYAGPAALLGQRPESTFLSPWLGEFAPFVLGGSRQACEIILDATANGDWQL